MLLTASSSRPALRLALNANSRNHYRCLGTVAGGRKAELSFADHRTAYARLSHGEVLRAWLVLKLCSLDFLVQNSLKVRKTPQPNRLFPPGAQSQG